MPAQGPSIYPSQQTYNLNSIPACIMPPLALNPNALPFQAQAYQPNPPPQAPKKRNSKQNPINISPSNNEAEFLKQELNISKTKIIEQDQTIKSFERKVHILESRLKILDEKVEKDLQDQYFTSSQQGRPTLPMSCPTCRPHTIPCHTCYPSHRQQCHPSPPSDQSNQNYLNLQVKLESLTNQVSKVESDICHIKCLVTNPSVKSVPPATPQICTCTIGKPLSPVILTQQTTKKPSTATNNSTDRIDILDESALTVEDSVPEESFSELLGMETSDPLN